MCCAVMFTDLCKYWLRGYLNLCTGRVRSLLKAGKESGWIFFFISTAHAHWSNPCRLWHVLPQHRNHWLYFNKERSRWRLNLLEGTWKRHRSLSKSDAAIELDLRWWRGRKGRDPWILHAGGGGEEEADGYLKEILRGRLLGWTGRGGGWGGGELRNWQTADDRMTEWEWA